MLEIKDLRIEFKNSDGEATVKGINLKIDKGERVGLVGESGSGKTITALTIAGLISREQTKISGEILFDGVDLLKCTRSELRAIQGKDISMVFQEPMTSLNPLMRVGQQIEEPLKLHTNLSAEERYKLAINSLKHVDLPEPEVTYNKYPHQMSGGQRQRAIIASAIISDPKLLIADEPTTALDVTVQAQIMRLLNIISTKRGVAVLFISHDLYVVRKLCERVAVMRGGEIVEVGATEDIFQNPQHEYTKKLISAIPGRRRRGLPPPLQS